MAEYSVTVTGVAVDNSGRLFSSVAYYNGESFYSFVVSESDVASRTVPNARETLLKRPVWFTNLWRSKDGRIFVCDGDGRMHIGSDTGGDWTVHDVSQRTLTVVWGFGSDEAYAAGSAGVVYRWDGRQWTALSSPLGNTIQGIAGTSPSDLYVCGEGALLWRFNGADWEQIQLPTDRNLVGLLVLNTEDVLVSGSGGTLFRGADATWADVSQPGHDFYEMAIFLGQIFVGGGPDGLYVFDDVSVHNVKSTFSVYSASSNETYLATAGDNESCRFDGVGWFGPTYT